MSPQVQDPLEELYGTVKKMDPASVEGMVRQAAKDYGVDPDLAARVAKQESNFNHAATSPKGARGVMQLMPDAAKDMGVNPEDFNDNIRGGVKLLAQHLKTYGGDVNKALAAYNAGPGRVDSGKPLPAETQDYVSKITATDPLEEMFKSMAAAPAQEEKPAYAGIPGMEQLGGAPPGPPKPPSAIPTPRVKSPQELAMSGMAGSAGADPTLIGPITEGPVEMGAGLQNIANAKTLREAAKGGTQVISGGFQTLAPLIPAAAASAPVATAASIALGSAADYLTTKGMQALGVPKEYAGLGGAVAALLAGGKFGHEALTKLHESLGSPEVKLGKFDETKPFSEMSDEELLAHANAIEKNPPKNYDFQKEQIVQEAAKRQAEKGLGTGTEPTAQPEPAPLAENATYSTPDGDIRVRRVTPDKVIYEVKTPEGTKSAWSPIDKFREKVGLAAPEAAGPQQDPLEQMFDNMAPEHAPPPPESEVVQPASVEAPAAPEAEGQPPAVSAPPVAAGSPGEPPPAGYQPGQYYNVKPSDFTLDPVRFQFKQEGIGQKGVTGQFKDVKKWNPDLAGTVHGWVDPETGNLHPVNGHHRVDLGQRIGDEGVPEGIHTRILEAKTAQEARAKGALINIAEGNGTPIDIAKFLRDSGTSAEALSAQGVELTKGAAKQGGALAKLAQPIFDDVVQGKLPVERAALIGSVENKPDQQAIYDIVKKREKEGKRPTNDQIEELIRMSNAAGKKTVTNEDDGQTNMFGVEEMEQSLLPEKAEVSDYIRKQLGAEKKLFGAVASQGAAERLGEAGNVIKAGENAAVAERANQGIYVYDKMSVGAGPLDSILEKAARRLADGENATDVKQQAYREARAEVQRLAAQFAGKPAVGGEGVEAGGEGRGSEVGPGNGAEAGAGSELEGPSAVMGTRPLPGDQPLFPPETEQELNASAKLHEDRLLGARLTAQLRSGMAARPANLKPAQPKSLFEDAEPEQESLFGRKPHPDQMSLFDERSTALDAAPTERTGTFQLHPQSIRRLAEPVITDPTKYWTGAKSYAGKLGGHPAIFTNGPGFDMVLRGIGATGAGKTSQGIGGLTLTPGEWKNIAKVAGQNLPEGWGGTGFVNALKTLASQLPKDYDGPVIALQTGPRMTDAILKRIGEEEVDHAEQMKVPGGLRGMPAEVLDTPEGKIAAESLVPLGYVRLNPASPFYEHNRAVIAAEVGVRLMRPGRWQELGLTYDQALKLFEDYTRGLEKHGAAAGSIINQIYASKPTTAPERRSDRAAQHAQGGEGAPQGRPESTPEVRGEGAGTEAKPVGPPDFTRQPPQTIVRPPAKGTHESRVVTFEDKPQPAAGRIEDAKNKIARTIKGNKVNISEIGAISDVFNRNLSQISKASPEVDAAAVKAASFQARASTVMHAVTGPMDKALQGSGITLPETFQTFIESRLRGIRDGLWRQSAEDAKTAPEYDLLGELPNTINLLNAIEGRGGRPATIGPDGKPIFGTRRDSMPSDLGQTAAALAESGDIDSLRAFLEYTFNDAADRVTSVMDPAEFDRITADPAYQKAKGIYKRVAEKELRETHEEHEGHVSQNLGPEDTYFPLIPIGKQHPGPGMQRTPYGQPTNVANRLATGLSPEYDSTIKAFHKRLVSALHSSDKFALLRTMEDSGWLKEEPRGGAARYVDQDGKEWPGTPAFQLPDGRILPGKSVPVSKERTIVQAGKKAIHKPAKTGVIPLFMFQELEPILDGKGYNNPTNLATRIIHGINTVAVAGLAEPIYHGRNVAGGLISNLPFVAKALGANKLNKLKGDLDKVVNFHPNEEEYADDLIQMSKFGIVPDRFGRLSYDARTAELMAGEHSRFSLAPLLFGTKGVDIKVRWLLYKTIKTLNPEASPREITDFVNQVGNYTYGLQGGLERWLKHTGVGPFATAGISGIKRGIKTWTGVGPNPTPGISDKLFQQILGGGIMATVLWAVAYHSMTGHWPTQKKGAKFGYLPISGPSRHSKIGNALFGEGSGDGEINMFSWHPDFGRGSRLFGIPKAFQTYDLGGTPTQMAEAVATEAGNTVASPVMGPAARTAMAGGPGVESYVTGLRDQHGRPGPQFFSALPKNTNRMKLPLGMGEMRGLPSTAAWHALAATKEMNNFYHSVATSIGLFPANPDEKDNGDTVRSIVRMGSLGLIDAAAPYNPYKAQNALRQQRQGMK